MYFAPMNGWYFVFALPGLLLGFWAQASLRGTFSKYAQVATASGVTGQDAAHRLIAALRLNIGVRSTSGQLTDFYDPSTKSINLSESSAYDSVASVAVVAHEIGHAQQDAQGYVPMRMRSAIVPAVRVGSWVGPIMFFAGYFFNSPSLAFVGVVLFSAVAVFSLVTLPVEFDASRRGLAMLTQNGIVSAAELPGAKAVLRAAAFTYVAAALQAIGTVLYYASILSRRRD